MAATITPRSTLRLLRDPRRWWPLLALAVAEHAREPGRDRLLNGAALVVTGGVGAAAGACVKLPAVGAVAGVVPFPMAAGASLGMLAWTLGLVVHYATQARVRLANAALAERVAAEDRRRAEQAHQRAEQLKQARRGRQAAADARDDAWRTLGLAPGASPDAIKQAYRALVKRHHPDANGGGKAAEERLKVITLAYATLTKGRQNVP